MYQRINRSYGGYAAWLVWGGKYAPTQSDTIAYNGETLHIHPFIVADAEARVALNLQDDEKYIAGIRWTSK